MYTGDYFNDLKHGKGKFVWESGNYYEGQYFEDKRNGYGEMHWNDGTIYKGEWQYGAQHGHGKLCLPNGEVKSGIFENNVLIMLSPNSKNPFEVAKLSIQVAEDIFKEESPEKMVFED